MAGLESSFNYSYSIFILQAAGTLGQQKKAQPEKDPQPPAHPDLLPWVSASVRYQGTSTETQDPALELRLPHNFHTCRSHKSVTEGRCGYKEEGIQINIRKNTVGRETVRAHAYWATHSKPSMCKKGFAEGDGCYINDLQRTKTHVSCAVFPGP